MRFFLLLTHFKPASSPVAYVLNSDSVDTCNAFFEIENEYGAIERKVGSAFQAVEMAGDSASTGLRDILQDHDRNRVSKRIAPLLPRTLPSWMMIDQH